MLTSKSLESEIVRMEEDAFVINYKMADGTIQEPIQEELNESTHNLTKILSSNDDSESSISEDYGKSDEKKVNPG
jgi:hypothetical protein